MDRPSPSHTASQEPAPPPGRDVAAGPAALSIRSRVLLLIGAVAVFFAGFEAYWAVQGYRTAVRAAEDQVLAVAQSTSAALEQFLAYSERSLASLAQRQGVALLQERRCRDVMRPLADAFPGFLNVFVVDGDGSLVCGALDGPRAATASAAERVWFRELRRTREFSIGHPEVGPISGGWVVAMGSPILGEDGRLRGAVAGTIDLLRLENLISGRAAAADELVTITTADGVVVARSRDGERWVGRALPSGTVEVDRRGPNEFITRTEDATGLARVWGRADLPEVGWRVYTGVPSQRVYGPNLRRIRDRAVTSTAILLVTVLASIVLFRGIAGSLTLLATGVRQAQVGRSIEVPPGAPPEVVQVVTQLNRTLDDRNRAQESERAARARLQDLLDNAVFGIYVSTSDGRFLQVNQALVSMLGYDSPGQLIAVGPEALYRDPAMRQRIVRAYADVADIEDVELEWMRRDGQPLVVRVNGKAVDLPDGERAFEVIAEDITEQRALAELTRHQQKMEAVGRLAGGVAHDFNNLLTVLGVNTEMIQESLEPDDPRRHDVDEMAEALARAGTLTRKLLAFSRKEVTQPRLLDLNSVVSGLEGMLRRVLGERVHLECDLAASLGKVWIDPGHVEQVILNLVLNARDALGTEGGRIRISSSTRAAALGSDAPDAARSPAAWYAVLTVADDGPGMDEHLLQLIFEPFFTTKPPGVGTGLGLPTVYGIAVEAGGRVTVESRPGQGAAFEVWLPVAVDEVDPARQAIETGDATLLLVSANAALRQLAVRAVEVAGYRVVEAAGPAQALDAFWRHAGPIHVLVTEPDLPLISGEPLVRRLRKEVSGLPVLYLTDRPLAEEEPADDGAPRSHWQLVPFGPWSLTAAVHRALEAQGARSES